MDGYRISEAARATGFSVSALRFYEQEGVVVPERTATGYRCYRDDHVDALRFVARGKQLGLSLDDITELLALLDREECTPLQERIPPPPRAIGPSAGSDRRADVVHHPTATDRSPA
jgi:DNA-binding transcriptional MerR regulator